VQNGHREGGEGLEGSERRARHRQNGTQRQPAA
jgi:hypothetical protein